MLFLVFKIGQDAYAIDAGRVLEVLPLVRSKQIPHAPAGLAGLFNYHGTLVPLIDLTELTLGRLSETKMSTRIIVTNYTKTSDGKQLIGLKAEHVMETLRLEHGDFTHSGMSVPGSLYLGAVTSYNGRIIHQIEVDRILPESMREQLFGELVGSI